jgi:hypothetical protein
MRSRVRFVWGGAVAIGLLRIRAQAADHDRLTAREDSGEPRELTELAAAVVRDSQLSVFFTRQS